VETIAGADRQRARADDSSSGAELSPRISIAILNYQRREILRGALEAARRQRGAFEIIAVDNASTDGSAEMVQREFPDVRLIRLSSNVGAAGRNAGVTAAKGDIVVTLDNDVLFTTPHDVERVATVFARHPRAAIVNFMIVGADGQLSRRDWCHPRDADQWAQSEFPTSYVLEGASACRREAFLATGGYWPPLFIGHEGLDLALRLINAGHELVYTPEIRVRHLVEPSVRPSSRIYYTYTRNALWVALRNHRSAPAAAAIAQDLALMGFCAARAGELPAYVRGAWHAVRGARAALATRAPLSRDAYTRLKNVRAYRPGIVRRALRHVRERLI